MSDIKPRSEHETHSRSGDPMDVVGDELPDTKWPTTLGVICLIYAVGGLLCQVGAGVMPFASTFMMEKAGMGEIAMAPSLKMVAILSAVAAFCCGLIMLIGAINLLRRRDSGPRLLKVWVMIRLPVIVLTFAVGFLMTNASVDFTKQTLAGQNRLAAKSGQQQRPIPSDDELAFKNLRNAFVASGVFSIFPVFVGFFLSRAKIKEEVSFWH